MPPPGPWAFAGVEIRAARPKQQAVIIALRIAEAPLGWRKRKIVDRR
jgi:hypothetical protein